MAEYLCDVYPNFSSTDDYDTQNISSCPNDKYFNIELECTNMFVLNRNFETSFEIEYHTLSNVSKDELMQETIIVSWLSQIDVPQDAFWVVVSKLLECARKMVNMTHKNQRVLSIRVDLGVTRDSEDESDEDDIDFEFVDESDESSESNEDEEDTGLVPAAKSCVEGLEEVEKEGKCAICLEDFKVCVSMPCLHAFHSKCIRDWLEISNSCPLCRFKLSTRTSE